MVEAGTQATGGGNGEPGLGPGTLPIGGGSPHCGLIGKMAFGGHY